MKNKVDFEKFSEQILNNSLYECSICLLQIKENNLLCSECTQHYHTECIQDTLNRRPNCPNCNKQSVLADFKHDFNYTNMIEKTENLMVDMNSSFKLMAESSQEELYCKDCHKCVAEGCKSSVSRRRHKVVPLEVQFSESRDIVESLVTEMQMFLRCTKPALDSIKEIINFDVDQLEAISKEIKNLVDRVLHQRVSKVKKMIKEAKKDHDKFSAITETLAPKVKRLSRLLKNELSKEAVCKMTKTSENFDLDLSNSSLNLYLELIRNMKRKNDNRKPITIKKSKQLIADSLSASTLSALSTDLKKNFISSLKTMLKRALTNYSCEEDDSL
eukprot:CAMPEP_0168342826 /NCGR_PEP_ID=MMETSP0213-20121227/15651_1 /TAXON_ID=151035 /ORGANISM="Euplotes harpa, Strain FSP1.4" /LENGTH=329 /DNA_ID=CAMNT_0008349849 /DNA_START=402 /DNA_END=1391 /DNA_ORIENTATION=+